MAPRGGRSWEGNRLTCVVVSSFSSPDRHTRGRAHGARQLAEVAPRVSWTVAGAGWRRRPGRGSAPAHGGGPIHRKPPKLVREPHEPVPNASGREGIRRNLVGLPSQFHARGIVRPRTISFCISFVRSRCWPPASWRSSVGFSRRSRWPQLLAAHRIVSPSLRRPSSTSA